MGETNKVRTAKAIAARSRHLCEKFIVPFSHPDRFAILYFIANAGQPVSHAEIMEAIELSPSALTQHLKAMSPFISQKREGRTKLCYVEPGNLTDPLHLWLNVYKLVTPKNEASSAESEKQEQTAAPSRVPGEG